MSDQERKAARVRYIKDVMSKPAARRCCDVCTVRGLPGKWLVARRRTGAFFLRPVWQCDTCTKNLVKGMSVADAAKAQWEDAKYLDEAKQFFASFLATPDSKRDK